MKIKRALLIRSDSLQSMRKGASYATSILIISFKSISWPYRKHWSNLRVWMMFIAMSEFLRISFRHMGHVTLSSLDRGIVQTFANCWINDLNNGITIFVISWRLKFSHLATFQGWEYLVKSRLRFVLQCTLQEISRRQLFSRCVTSIVSLIAVFYKTRN